MNPAERVSSHQDEVDKGQRFEFGKNWTRFLSLLDDERIQDAEKSLNEMLKIDSLAGKRFLDAGCGSGLFSLAARRLGAEVVSFDYDPHSVACTRELKRRYFSDDEMWRIEEGSVLDEDYVGSLGSFDIVYSWGVLHHTGAMWKALEQVILPVAPGGRLYIAIYNDQGVWSKVWRFWKKLYCSSLAGRYAVTIFGTLYFVLVCAKSDLLRLRNPLALYRDYKKNRGMSIVHDWIDWFGGYPFEVARPDEIFDFYYRQGFQLVTLHTVGAALGCNELVFQKHA